jgi:hypothetical protein
MRVLVACERFGAVRDAFRALGHDAWSCDTEPDASQSTGRQYHIQGDVRGVLAGWLPDYGFDAEWHLMIAFPPCTYLCSSGLHWNTRRPGRVLETAAALRFVQELMDAPIERIAIENPAGCIGTRIRKSDQVIQPWQFGHDASKATHLWLKNLPPLQIDPAQRIAGRIVGEDKRGRTIVRWANQTDSGQNRLGPSDTRAAERGKTYPGIAAAMALQWGGALSNAQKAEVA